MDILQEWLEQSDELQPSLFCSDAQEHVPSLDHCNSSTRTLPLLTSVSSAPPAEATVSVGLLRSHSLDDIHHMTNTQAQLQLSRELPCLPIARSEGIRCQSVFPTCSSADTSHVEIALEMPRYLLQEDEAMPDETSEEASISATNSSTVPFKSSTLPVSKATISSLPLSISGEARLQTVRSDTLSDNTATNFSQHNRLSHSHKTVSDEDHSSDGGQQISRDVITPPPPVIIPPPPPTLAVCIPLMPTNHQLLRTAQLCSLNATPINVAQSNSKCVSNSVCEKKKRRHGGGWPKGKSRKVEGQLSPPRPPPTGYAIFVSEKRGSVQEQNGTNSMSVASRILGQMWSQLSPQDKEIYYRQAEKSKQHYFSEMRTYFAQYYKGASDDSLKVVDHLMNANFAAENDDHVVSCEICQLTFTSLNNKCSHFSGRLHLQALIEQLHRVFGSKYTPANHLSEAVGHEQSSRGQKSKDINEKLSHVAMQHKATITQLEEVQEHYRAVLWRNVDIQQQLHELEYTEARECELVRSLATRGNITQVALDALTTAVNSLAKCTTDFKYQTSKVSSKDTIPCPADFELKIS